MTQPYNPYAPPGAPGYDQASPYYEGPLQCGRIANLMVVPPSFAALPPRCVRCNGPGHKRLTKTYYWHEPWIYLTILAGILIYAIVASIQRKSVRIEFSLCERHATIRLLAIFGGWFGGVGAMVLMFLSASDGQLGLMYTAIGLLVVSMIAGVLFARSMTPSKIDLMYGWMKVGEPFLESLPPPPGMG